MVKKFLALLICTLPLIALAQEESSHTAPKITYYDENNQALKTDWEIDYSRKWEKSEHGEELLLDVWVVLPPLLDIASTDTNYRIVENTKDNHSPFHNNSDIKKVLNFKTQKQFNVISLDKTSTPADNDIRVTVQLPSQLNTVVHHTNCTNDRLKLKLRDSSRSPFLTSVYCKDDIIYIDLSPDYKIRSKSIESYYKTHLSKNTSESRLTLYINNKSDDEPSNILNFEVYNTENNLKNGMTLARTSQKSSEPQLVDTSTDKDTITYQKWNEENTRVKDVPLNSKNDGLSVGALISKNGLELYADFERSLNNHDFHIKLITPLNDMFDIRRPSQYHDLSFNYTFYNSHNIDLGLGVWTTYLTYWNSLKTGPDVFIRLNQISVPLIKYSFSLSLTSSYLHSDSQRHLIQFESPLLKVKYGMLKTHIMYGYLESDLDTSYHFHDHKVLGGLTFQW